MMEKGSLTLAMLMNFSIILARCLTLGGDKIMVPTQDEIKLKWAMHAWNAADPRFVFHTWRSISLGCSQEQEIELVNFHRDPYSEDFRCLSYFLCLTFSLRNNPNSTHVNWAAMAPSLISMKGVLTER